MIINLIGFQYTVGLIMNKAHIFSPFILLPIMCVLRCDPSTVKLTQIGFKLARTIIKCENMILNDLDCRSMAHQWF